MLNTFANHGFFPRNGHDITKQDLDNAQVHALNMSPGLASKTTNAMSAKPGPPKNSSTAVDLEDFAAHDHTEHDALLTRLDVLRGSGIDVDPGRVRLLLKDSPLPWLNTSSIGRSRARREAESRRIGSLRLSDAFTAFGQLEASFIILAFGIGRGDDTDAWGAPKDQLRTWLNEGRSLSDDGYRRSEEVKTAEIQSSIIAGIKHFYNEFVDDYQ
ncbi:hypothetical protein LTS18_001747 [Coniosporium uncinatum]|uniref:Uncharacterized protein n=1 Tax=Coniosporium uncinatum TaxID=93489 RepID=A0ACC3D895_9PEZI|nr:hypothetical protein LTS18_001747 [Coniosporium uncinatum]